MKSSLWLPGRLPTRFVLGATLGLLCAPVLIDLAVSGRSGPFTYVAADTFYYLTVARNIARHGLASYDGQHLTNGFHPLWQSILAGLHFLTEHLGIGHHTVLVAVLASLVLVAGGLVALGCAFAEAGALTPLFALLPVGIYGLLLAPFWLARLKVLASESVEGPFPVYGTLWSYANGMESGAVLLCFGICAYFHQAYTRKPSRSRTLGFGLAAGALVLARLDHVIVILPVVLAFCVAARQRSGSWRPALSVLLCFGLPLAIDVAVNILVFGEAVPVSGALKLSFPFVTPVHIQSWIDTWRGPYYVFVVQREASLLVPLLFALAYLASTLRVAQLGSSFVIRYREAARDIDRFLAPLALGVVLFGSHEILFLTDGPGSWHLPVSTLFVSLAVVAVVDRGRPRLDRRAALAAGGLIAGLTVAFFVTFRQPAYHWAFAKFYLHEAPLLKQTFGTTPVRFLEADDGIVNYSLDVPAMSSGLALDPEGLDAKRGGQLYALAYERGFNCISSLAYLSGAALAADSSAEAARTYAKTLIAEDLSAYDFHLAYLTPSASVAIVCGQKK
jgi:hypothetical protein